MPSYRDYCCPECEREYRRQYGEEEVLLVNGHVCIRNDWNSDWPVLYDNLSIGLDNPEWWLPETQEKARQLLISLENSN